MGIAYLCSCCCQSFGSPVLLLTYYLIFFLPGCFKDITDPGTDGPQISRLKKHPKENDVKSDFMKRDYRKDKNGIMRFNSTPTVQVQPQRQLVMGEIEEGGIPRNEAETRPSS